MAGIQTGIELNDDFSQQIYSMVNAVNAAVSGMEQLQQTMNANVSTAGIDSVHDGVNRAAIAVNELIGLLDQLNNTDPSVDTSAVMPSTSAPLEQAQPRAPPDWWHDGLEVFTNTGIERFEQEVQSTDAMITGLTTNLQRTAQVAAGMNMLPPGAAQDIQSVQARLQAVQAKIQQIEANPMNIGVDAANDGLEELRSQLYQAQQAQEALDDALENMDVRGANEAYIQLSQTVSHTEQYIRDNVDEQGRFNAAIQDGTGIAAQLQRTIAGVVGAFAGMAGIRKAWGWIQDTTEAFNIQRNAETQLMTVLGNMVDYAEVPEFIVGIDDTLALSEAGELISTIDGMTVDITPEMKTDYLLDQFDSITAKASEIQSRGMYGDEAMIAAAGEFATYMSDVEAIGTMMDTLTNYAAGMSGGGEIDTTTMVDYATNLGKIMTGAYDAMTKKGFEFTDAQKAVIDGSATEQQYIEALGEEYVNMSEDMRSATVIADIINESWAGLYETMSDTPQGRIQQMTNAFGDMKEVIGGQLYPYVMLFVDSILANSGVIQSVLDGFTTALQFVMGVLAGLMDVAFQVASVIIDNWSIIEPIVMGVAGALMVYYGAQLAANTISAISTGIHMAMAAAQMAHAAMTGTLTAATAAQIAAQEGLNAAMYASPIVWIVMLVIALVAAIYAVCSAIAQATGIAQSGLGVIAGAIGVVIGFFQQLWSAAMTILSAIGAGAAALGNNMVAAFHNSIANIQSFFYNLLSTAMSVISQIASALSALPFVEFDAAGLAGAAGDYAAKAQAAQDSKMEYQDIGAAFQEQMAGFSAFQSGWAADSFNAGAAVGDGIASSIGDALSFDNMFNTESLSDMGDLATAVAGGVGSGLDASGVPGAAGGTADNTGKMAQEMSKTAEDLKYLRDIAEQETVNRYTLAEVNVDMSGMSNNINNGMDLDGVVSGLTDAVNESIDNITEGVHE